MLRVVYEATDDLCPDAFADIKETRGLVTVKLRRGTDASAYLPQLNSALSEFVGRCGWFQIWRGQVISAASPESPLSVQFEADPALTPVSPVQIREHRGIVRLHVSPTILAQDLVKVLNPAIEQFLAGGQWFQYWEGEIITMDPPPDAAIA